MIFRREFLKWAGSGLAGASGVVLVPGRAGAQPSRPAAALPHGDGVFNVRTFGAVGDGKAIDSPAINAAIAAAEATGGGTVLLPPGTYASYSVRLKSGVALYLSPGATLLAAAVPLEGTTSGGYDAAEPQGAWEPYQDYGHNHWQNSLIWGEGLHDVAILGPGRIYGKGLSRGHSEDTDLPKTTAPGVGNKAIALKNCRNVLLRDFSILQGGWFGLLATGVDNMTIDNLLIDTNRDGLDVDCCRNVRITGCSVNSPWDDGICPKSSFALGYARATENLTISDCYVTGDFQVGTMLDGTWKRYGPEDRLRATGRIKCGTESNGGFKNITVSNCVFESCHGFALESVDGALCEDITFTGITMRDLRTGPLFFRLGARMRGPKGVPVGALRRVIVSNVTSYGAVPEFASAICGVPGHPVEDVRLADVYLHQQGGGGAEWAALQPPEKAEAYPEPNMFGTLPATGLYLRHVRGLDVSNVEVATERPDARPAFVLDDVEGGDFFRVKVPGGAAPAFTMKDVRGFRVFGSRTVKDTTIEHAERSQI